MPPLHELLTREKQRPYSAQGGAMKMWCSREEEILLEGPAGTGKSRGVLEKLHFCAQKYPGMRGLIVRKTRESCTESVLVTFESKVVPPGHPCLKGPSRKLRSNYTYPNGSEIVVGGMDKPAKVMSTEYDMIAVFEATECNEEDQENLTTRLRNGVMPYQQIIDDCNPATPSHWLNKRANQGKMQRILSRHEDNPILFWNGGWTERGQKYISKLDRLSGARRLRLLQGKWAASEGMVYEGWNRDLHVLPQRIGIPRDWRRIIVIDFGFKNPFVAQWWAIDPDGNMYMYREIYKTRRLVRDHAIHIKALSKDERFEAIISDHDLEDRSTLHESGIMTMPAHKAIEPGIEAVRDRLRVDPTTKKPRLFILPDSLVERDEELSEAGLPISTDEEFEGYVYPKNQDGKAIKELPVPKDDHGMDTVRYAVCYVDNVAAVTIGITAESATVVRRTN